MANRREEKRGVERGEARRGDASRSDRPTMAALENDSMNNASDWGYTGDSYALQYIGRNEKNFLYNEKQYFI